MQRRYALPVLSGIALALVFFPFYLWPLVFVALAPFFYFVLATRRSTRELLFGGFFVGVIGIGPLVYLSLAQLMLFPDAPLFTFVIRASSVPTVLLVGMLFAFVGWAYSSLRSPSTLLNITIAASLYLLVVECPLFWIFDGYYYGALSHAAAALPPVLFAAALGGAPLVSFIIVLGNAALAEALHARQGGLKNFLFLPGLIVFVWGSFYVGEYLQPFAAQEGKEVLAIAVIQDRFESYTPQGPEEVVIYPFSLSGGITTPAEDGAIGEQVARLVSTSTTVVLWQTTEEAGAYYDELAMWRAGEKSAYRKRTLYALSDDYTPQWLRNLGIEKSPYGIMAGAPDNAARINGQEAGALICSELHQSELARATASNTPFIIAVGSDSMFPGSLSGDFSLAAARLRAAENATPLIRANLAGPSAVINADGSLQATLGYGEQGILRGDVSIAPYKKTPYAQFGAGPTYGTALFVVAFASALAFRRRAVTAPDTREPS